MIQEVFLLSATDTDVLNAPSRLAAIPYSGQLTIELSTSTAAAANHFDLTLSLPNGDVPVDGQMVPLTATGICFNQLDKVAYTFPVSQGGHVTVNLTLTGTAIICVRATLMP